MTTTMHLNENKEKINKFIELNIENKNVMLTIKLSPMTLKEVTKFINENA